MNITKPYTVKLLPDLPILVVEVIEGYAAREHQDDVLAQSRKILDASQEPLFVINVTKYKSSMDDVMYLVNSAARSDGAIWKHPNIRGMFWVSTDILVKLSVKGLDSNPFGNLKQTTVETFEEALRRIREILESD